MKLRIPEQTDGNDSVLPIHPRKFKKWLANLPQANMGEVTRQIFSAIRELNRKKIPPKHRLEIMEMMREPSRGIFDNLKKYFINRTFPLPEKSKKIVNLNQALLQEMAMGYKIIIQQAVDKSEKVDTKSQTIAIARAIKYQSEFFLRASEIYATAPTNIWKDTHQIFAYAVETGLDNKTIDDCENPNKKTSILNTYKQMLLFSLSRPTALRQSDTERVYNKLYSWVTQTNLNNETQENQINKFFCVHIDKDRPPSYLNQQDCDSDNKVFTLETTELVNNIQKEIDSSKAEQDSIAVGEDFSIETLNALTVAWGAMPKRRFSRAGKQGHIPVAIGLTHAAKMIRENNLPDTLKEVSDSFNAGNSFSLESIPEELKSMSDGSSSYLTHTEIGGTQNNAWDMVARGRTMTDAFDQQRQLVESENLKLNKEDDDLHWEIVNISAGGYCLRWNSENTSKAQIGEIIAIHELESNGSYEWRIGAIRWMQFTAQNGLEIGIQVLSPKVIAAEVQRVKKLNEEPFDALMIPGIRPLKQSATIILPAHAFKTGDKLRVKVYEQDIGIALTDKKEHTGSFTQFQFIHKDQQMQKDKTDKKSETSKKKDDFDEIWSSL